MTFLDRSISWQQKHSLEPMRRIVRRALRHFCCASSPLIMIYTSTYRPSQRKLSICAILSVRIWSARKIRQSHVSYKYFCGTQNTIFGTQKRPLPRNAREVLLCRCCLNVGTWHINCTRVPFKSVQPLSDLVRALQALIQLALQGFCALWPEVAIRIYAQPSLHGT